MADEAAVYVSWTTFKNAMEGLAQGVPNVVDRSAFPGLSWAVQAQLLTGLRFLGLITEEGKPTAALHGVAVTDEATRKKKLEAILRDRYANLFALDLMKATPGQLNDTLRDSYNVSGDTLEKASRFFLSAVKYVGVPVSRFLQKESGNGSPAAPRRRRAPSIRTRAPEPEVEPNDEVVPSGGTSRSVILKSGGTLTVSASMDVFKLSTTDRTFVFGLIDKLEEYEKQGS